MARLVSPARELRRALLCAALSLAFDGPAAHGEETHAPRELPPVTARGEAAKRAHADEADPTGFATVIEARRGEAATAQELVLSSPGVSVRDFGLNQSATLSVRGSSSDEVLVLLDGLPLNAAAGGGVDLSTLPAPFLERLTVARGAVGARYGAGALGGAVLLEARRPRKGERSLFGELSFGSFGTGEASAGLLATIGSAETLAMAYGRVSQGDFPFLYNDRPQLRGHPSITRLRQNNDARRAGGLFRMSLPGAGTTRADLLVEASVGERGLPGPAQSPSPLATQRDARGLAIGRLSRTLGFGLLEARAGARLSRLVIGDGSEDAPSQDETLAFGEVSLRRLEGRHALELGASAGRESLTSLAHGRRGRARLAAFAADEITLPFAAIFPSLRAESLGESSGLSGKLGASFPLTAVLSLKANAGRSFRAPSFGELYLEQGAMAPNPLLRPETALFADLGLSARGKSVEVSASGFYTLFDDLILYEIYAPLRAKPLNFGKAEVYGAEIDLLAAVGPLSLALGTTLAFSENRLDDERYFGKDLPYHPRHRVHARVGLAHGPFAAHLEINGQTAQFLNRTSTDFAPGRARLDGGTQFIVDRSKGLVVSLQMKNVLDSSDQDLYGHPLPGRALYASARIDAESPGSP